MRPKVGAFFDLDGTLVDGFTATAHAGDRIRRRQARIGEVMGVIEASMRYKFGADALRAAAGARRGDPRGESLAELDEIGERLFGERVRSRVFPAMHQIVVAHQRRGHTVVLELVGADDSRRAGRPVPGDRPRVVQPLRRRRCGSAHRRDHQARHLGRGQKAAAVQQFCAAGTVDLTRSYFYADGDEDAALMKLVGFPRPVNPRRGLAAAAAEHDWPVLRMSPTGRGFLGCRRSVLK